MIEYQTTKKFEEFYAAYPKKVDRRKAAEFWSKNQCEKISDTIIGDVIARKRRHDAWQDRKFIPSPLVYLRGNRWEDEIVEKASAQTTGKRSSHQIKPIANTEYQKKINAMDSIQLWGNRALLLICQQRGGFSKEQLQCAIRVKNDWVNGVRAIRNDPNCDDPQPDFPGFKAAILKAIKQENKPCR